MKDIVERFLDYVSFETTSYEPIEGQASSVGQYVLAKHLKEELEKLDVKTYILMNLEQLLDMFQEQKKDQLLL